MRSSDWSSDVCSSDLAAVAVAERFNSALSSGDLATVEALLAADVLILESGGAEHSREEYMGHHAVSDAAFLKGAHRRSAERRVGKEGSVRVALGGRRIIQTKKNIKKRY